MSAAISETAPAKVNLVLHVGPVVPPGGLHEIASLFASLELVDTVRIGLSDTGADEVHCSPPIPGLNLAARALRDLRDAAPEALIPHLRVDIEKRIPVAAGLAGGSADAAAVLRAAHSFAKGPLDQGALGRVARDLGSDVPSQMRPANAIVGGTGELVEPIALPALELVLVPDRDGLLAGEVFTEAERLGLPRRRVDTGALRSLGGAGVDVLGGRCENDLEAAVLSLRPALAERIERLRSLGAAAALVSGSGPTVFGVFANSAAADRAAQTIPEAIRTRAAGS